MGDNMNESLLERYGENFTKREYVTNPAIGRDDEIKQLILILLMPEKSGILIGKPGIGKTAIVEGLGYRIQRGEVPDALKGYSIWKLNTASLIGVMPGTNEPKITQLLSEIKDTEKLILFIDEIHTLIGTGVDGGSMDFAQVFKPGLDRGNIKIIGATTTEEYERYILRDKAFLRRFEKVIVSEPTREQAIEILMGTIPKIEHQTGVKMGYSIYIQQKVVEFIVDFTKEYNRVYENQSRYPDVALTLLRQAFSNTVFDNRKTVILKDVLLALQNTKAVYPDVKKKEIINFKESFKDLLEQEDKKEEVI